MSNEESSSTHYAQSPPQMFPPPQQKETLGRRAAQKLRRARPASKLAALGSELSQSASALYSLFTQPNGNGGERNGDSEEEEREFDRRSVISVDHLPSQHHYQQPMIHSSQQDKAEQIYAASVHMNAKLSVSMAMQMVMELTVNLKGVGSVFCELRSLVLMKRFEDRTAPKFLHFSPKIKRSTMFKKHLISILEASSS
jgi:hypothetical protein